MIWFDWTIIIMIPAILLGLIVQIRLSTTYSRYSKVQSRTGMTGYTAARRILDAAGLRHVPIECIQGELTDHFDPRSNVLRLSNGVYNSSSVAAIGVAAHECGHAVQHAQNYSPLSIRSALVPIANIGSSLSWPLVLIGLLIGGSASNVLIQAGILLFVAVVLFQVVTLPVEFNASRRGLRLLGECGILYDQELPQTRKVLKAAALTYVAGVLASLLQLLRLLMIANRRRD